MDTEASNSSAAPEERFSFRENLRRLLVFQLKLAADAMRDFALSPLSLVLGIIDISQRNPDSRSYFCRLMALGRRSDHFINLFGAEPDSPVTLDTVVDDAERAVTRRLGDARQAEQSQAGGNASRQ